MKRLLALSALVAACTSSPGTHGTVGMANPASVHCQQKGGTLRLVSGPAGQTGICALPDGTEVEEWELYRRDHR